jgi:hypothetical protein
MLRAALLAFINKPILTITGNKRGQGINNNRDSVADFGVRKKIPRGQFKYLSYLVVDCALFYSCVLD